MHNIAVPNIDDEAVFENCVGVKAKLLRDRFAAASATIHAAGVNYRGQADAGNLVALQSIVGVDLGVTDVELRALYNNQFVNKQGPERKTYDKILLGARRCPFCSHRQPRTLDHYLPKETFSEFSIFSANLVPCCRDCNSEKLGRVLSEEEQLLHPYFDSISDFDWLDCDISYMNGAPIYRFFVANIGIPEPLLRKMRYQMRELGLDTLYALEAADEVGGITSHLTDIFEAEQSDGVRLFLGEQADSRSKYDRNSWQAVLYRALSFNDQFCEMAWGV